MPWSLFPGLQVQDSVLAQGCHVASCRLQGTRETGVTCEKQEAVQGDCRELHLWTSEPPQSRRRSPPRGGARGQTWDRTLRGSILRRKSKSSKSQKQKAGGGGLPGLEGGEWVMLVRRDKALATRQALSGHRLCDSRPSVHLNPSWGVRGVCCCQEREATAKPRAGRRPVGAASSRRPRLRRLV